LLKALHITNDMDILRFLTAGSVDDGKSTLIGRLLYDSDAVLQDQLEAIKSASRINDDGTLDLAILTDGLRAEREQGITIDVAYKYFNTPKRKFIIADAPGHIQYTRNMVTGASNVDLAIVLIDARKGVVEQTLRHSFIVSLLQIPHVVVCVNKMDLVDFSEEVFNRIVADYQSFYEKLQLKDIKFIPVSALKGDNVVDATRNMPWYEGESLLHYLEHIPIQHDHNLSLSRFPVQWVIRPQTTELHDYRGYAGKIISGIYRKGDQVTCLPSGFSSTIERIETFDGDLEEAHAPQSVTLHLADEIDVSRGDMIVRSDSQPYVSQDLEADMCWMDTKPLRPGNRYLLQHFGAVTRCVIKEVLYKVNINTLEHDVEDKAVQLNDICRIVLRTARPLVFDEYRKNRANGGFILIDESTNVTVGACMITKKLGIEEDVFVI
jgi:sulfate adenylyltransferase subunit 1